MMMGIFYFIGHIWCSQDYKQLSPKAKNSGQCYYIYVVIDTIIAVYTRKYCDIVLGPYRPSLI